MTARRPEPNILITGTPGTGKTTLADQVAQVTGLKRIDVGEIAKQQNLYDGFDENYDCHNLDEEKLMGKRDKCF